MTDPNNQNTSGVAPEGPPLKQPCLVDTPPIALTAADDGSDFYNTPLTAGTPIIAGQKPEGVSPAQASEASKSAPPPLIPGLSLVNENRAEQTDSTIARDDSSNRDVAMGNVSQPTVTHDQADSKTSGTEEPAQRETDAMEVEHENKPSEGATSNKASEEATSTDNDTSGTTGENTAEATGPAQDGEQEEEQEEEHPEWELDSSPYESSSDDSSTDSSDSEEEEDYPILSPEEQARILMQGELGSDDEGEGKGKSGAPLRTANEVPEEVPQIPAITITPEMKIVLLGNVEAVVENTMLIAANTSGEYQVLEAGSLLCLEDRRVAGVVSETLGRVENPLYAVMFPTVADIEERGLSRGTPVYYVEEHSTFVFTQPLKGLKGSDASNFHDEEVGEDEVEFSDDEQEAEYKRKLKQKRQERKGAKNDKGGSAKGARGPPGPSKLSQSELNYDDNPAEDGYTPLARPKNLHEMMRQEAPVESDGFSNRNSGFGAGRGRGRGSDRGRGGRGRGSGPRNHHGTHSHQDRQSYYQHERPEAQQQPLSQHQTPQYPGIPYNQPQQYPPSYQPMPQQPQQQQQQQPYTQGTLPTAAFNLQMPFQHAYQQPNPYQHMPTTPHINPLFLAALQQQQQFQQQQYQQPQQPTAGQPQTQNQTMNFDQVKAQLDLLRQLSNNGNQWPPSS
ncbi:Gar1/Naf1 RNA binding region-domain-containing protein [Aspergillus egyptiacus]|nr:Gar1/Naf1 RNA binding region-domain-containing protein [Aspergillus egyptiacus]